MARRDVFKNIKAPTEAPSESKSGPRYTERGASRNMLSSISELAEKAAKADQLLAGGAVIEIEPSLIDISFVTDRMDEDEDAFQELVNAIRERGQDSPVLLRPNPAAADRFQIVFGHRRVRAARLLDRKVKAVVRDVSDIDHVIAQGQENSARENLSFIERALFAQQLIDLGHDRTTVQSALTVDAPMLTRMLTVTDRVPVLISKAIGPAKTIGRDRWLELAQAIQSPAAKEAAQTIVDSSDFESEPSDVRFERVLKALKGLARPRRNTGAKPSSSKWQAGDKAVTAEVKDSGKSVALTFKSKDGGHFARFLAANLDRLYGEFKRSESEES